MVSSRMLIFCSVLATLLALSVVVVDGVNRDAFENHKGSVRGIQDEEDIDSPWWRDPNVLEPSEKLEIEEEEQINTVYRRSTVGPFLGPIVHVGQDDNSSAEEDITPQRTSRIVHGSVAEPHSFFAMLLVKEGGNWRWSGCGGTLVSNCEIVTAGHCVIDPILPVVGVFINAYSPFAGNNSGVPYHFSPVQEIDIHPNFVLTTNEADLAIIHLQECVDVQKFPPALLAEDIDDYTRQYRPPPHSQQVHAPQNPPSPLIMQVLGFGSMLDDENGTTPWLEMF